VGSPFQVADAEVAAIRQWVADRRVMTVATTDGGTVWAAAVFYVNDGFRFFFISPDTARHSRNIDIHPQVALTIQDEGADWESIRGLQVSGVAELLLGEAAESAARLYARKYPFISNPDSDELKRAIAKASWYGVSPTNVYFIDNTRGLGRRIELPAK